MPVVMLIRHAENEYVKSGRLAGRKPGVHLNEKGQAQTAALAEALRQVPVKAVYSSPLVRTMETAVPIAELHQLEVIVNDGLLEVDYGEWQDRTLKQLRRRKLWKTVQNSPAMMRFPGGESFAEAQLRITDELNRLAAAHKQQEVIVCVSHSDMIKLAAAYFIGQPLDFFQRLIIQPASVTTLHIAPDEGARLLNLNHIAYRLSDE
ncbi:MAG: histidine phosphatase family protein [Anaerolineales bacterium]|nr:histidine phosphatase family protein [Anaerolineales bacterium]